MTAAVLALGLAVMLGPGLYVLWLQVSAETVRPWNAPKEKK